MKNPITASPERRGPTLFFLIAVSILTLTTPHHAGAQSVADNMSALELKYLIAVARVAKDLQEASEDPSLLVKGRTKGGVMQASTELEALDAEVDAQIAILSNRKQDLILKNLPKNDLEELLDILKSKEKPLQKFKSRIAKTRSTLLTLEKDDVASWLITYQEFESIIGEERAREKLDDKITKSIAADDILAEAYSDQGIGKFLEQHSPATAPKETKANPIAIPELTERLKSLIPKANEPADEPSPTPAPTTAEQETTEVAESSEGASAGKMNTGVIVALFILWFGILLASGKSPRPFSLGNIFCALSSLAIPGAGQIGQRRILLGLAMMLAAWILWMLMLGWIMHLAAAVNALLRKKPATPPPLPA